MNINKEINTDSLENDVDLTSQFYPLHEIQQPKNRLSRLLLIAIIMGGISGIVIGVLAMAISMLAMSATELFLGTALNELRGIQISAFSFVIFSVLGWMLSTLFFHRYLTR